MGEIVGGIVGGLGSMFAASTQADAAQNVANIQAQTAQQASQNALTGYRYLTNGNGAAPTQAIIDRGNQAGVNQQGVQNAMMGLLGFGGGQPMQGGGQPMQGGGQPMQGGGQPMQGGGQPMQGGGQPMQGGGQPMQSESGAYPMQGGGQPMQGGGQPSGLPNGQPFGNGPATAQPPGQFAPGVVAMGGQTNGAMPPPTGSTAMGGQPMQGGSGNPAFDQYLNSTGYKFQLGQGQQAIASSAAAGGLLNSGATAKALEQYGQNLGSSYFSNYLGQLGSLNNILGGTQGAGQNALGQVAGAGTAGGGAAAQSLTVGGANQGQALMQGANATAGGIMGAANSFGRAAGTAFNNPSIFSNFNSGQPNGMFTSGTGGLY
jgi:hypothetical protein